MHHRLAIICVATALSVLAAATATAASGAVLVGKAETVGQPIARQATLQGDCPTVGLDARVEAQEDAMLCLVNETRERLGLPALAESTPLGESAVAKGGDVLRCNEFSHTACGREFSFWIRETGYMAPECWRVGENLAWGVDAQGTVASIFRAWMRSPTHRANVLGNFEETGLDLRVGRLGGLSGVHLWTQHFGSHCNS